MSTHHFRHYFGPVGKLSTVLDERIKVFWQCKRENTLFSVVMTKKQK